ncbi:MAG: glucose-6-phosphate isomerase [Deltaproteobacteria bacterium]|nr:glucose-6-phosphate isomerase [Deltaproteobacteria bacterium]
MGNTLDLRFDFSLVLEKNLRSGEGLTAAQLRTALRRAEKAALGAARRHAAGEIGFPDLPFGVSEARSISRDAANLRKRFTHMLVLGIGGSALGTKAVLEGIGGEERRKGLSVTVADNVDPDSFFPILRSLPMKRTVVVAISKSGGTAETNAQLSLAIDALKKANGGSWKERLILVTDPEKGIFRRMAAEEGIKAYPVPPNVGGRFSVLSPVGLLPIAAAGVSVERLLDGARFMEETFRGRSPEDNPVLFASAVYAHYMISDLKPVHVWMTYGKGLERVAEWWQQLWGESLGKTRKDGKAVGQTPARAVGVTDQHSQVQLYQDGPADKIYTFVRWREGKEKGIVPRAGFAPDMSMLGGRPLRDLFDAEFDGTVGALWSAGRPIVRIDIGARDEAHIGAYLHFWEWVTAVVGECAGIDPFDQPGVEEGKKITRALMGEKASSSRRKEFLGKMKGRAPAAIRVRTDG